MNIDLVMSDGSSVAPFISAASNTQFQPTTDAADQMAFGISANQMALVASKSVSFTVELTPDWRLLT